MKKSLAVLTLALVAGSAIAQSSDFPNKAIRMIVPFAPGGNTDLSGRLVADRLAPKLGKPVIIESRPGAGGLVGVEATVRSDPDGYTIVLAGSGLVTFPATVKDLRFDVIKDLAPITIVNTLPFVLTASPGASFSSVKELVAFAKANPGKVTVGWEGLSTRLTIDSFNKLAGTTMTTVPYKGGVAITAAQLTNELSLSFATPLNVKAQVDAGKLRAFAVTSGKRFPMFPNAPTVAESGFPGFESIGWIGLFAPGATSKPVVERLNREIVPILQSQEIRDRMAALGVEAASMSVPEFTQFVASEVKRWTSVAKESGVVPD